MQVPCGGRSRIINAKILERDWFDKAPNTPENTLWTLELLQRLDKVIGPGVMDKPTFPTGTDTVPSVEIPDAEILSDLISGKYDGLFPGARDKLSDLHTVALKGPPPLTARVVRVEPIAADAVIEAPLPRLTGPVPVEYTVVRFDVDMNGIPINMTFENWPGTKPPYDLATTALQGAKFPATTTGQRLRAMIDFDTICPAQKP